jgi:dipeptidyl aminopeptidase/acylaminoacyl peptidase
MAQDCVITAYDVSEEGTVVYISVSDQELPEVSLLKEGENEKITSYNEAVSNRLNIRLMNHIRYRSFDDQEIDGWYLKPDGEGKAPLVVFVHGGPKGAYGYVPYYLSQILAEEGFYVLHTNPRGSNTYSEDFALQVEKDPGGGDFKDILSGIEVLISKEKVDSKRIGITGISYGGFMTNWAITHSQLFKAAVSENGISNWFTSYAFSDIGFWFDKELIGENPLIDESYKERSPIFSTEKVETPVLIIHSLEDYRCPLDQSVMFYHVLRDLGKEAYIAIFKKGPHGHSVMRTPRHRLKRYKLVVNFFVKKLREEEKEFKVDEIFAEKLH